MLAIAAVGICGSDIAMWAGTDPYATFPVRQGHEFSGRVVTFGPGYDGPLAVGQVCAPLVSISQRIAVLVRFEASFHEMTGVAPCGPSFSFKFTAAGGEKRTPALIRNDIRFPFPGAM